MKINEKLTYNTKNTFLNFLNLTTFFIGMEGNLTKNQVMNPFPTIYIFITIFYMFIKKFQTK